MRVTRFLALYRRHFRDQRRERMVLASASFFVTFGAARLLVHAFRGDDQPLQLWIAGIHVHHYVWGILLLLLVGYLWLIQVGTGRGEESHRFGRVTALLYGAGAALALDEFALWLHLEDVYWERTGRASVDAVLLFGALVSAGLWGGPFWRAVLHQGTRVLRRRAGARRGAGPHPSAPGVEEVLAFAREGLPGPTPEGLRSEPAWPEPRPGAEFGGSAPAHAPGADD